MVDSSNLYLDEENIHRSTDYVEWHPLKPFLPINAKILFLGSFPPPRKRWCMNFYYPNFINDHWRIEGEIWFGNKDYFVLKQEKRFDIERIINFCSEKGIAFFDTSMAISRLAGNASDKDLKVVVATDIHALIKQIPRCKAIITTGEKATKTICEALNVEEFPKANNFVEIFDFNKIKLYRLPSSSRAYPLAFDKKVAAYKAMFDCFYK